MMIRRVDGLRSGKDTEKVLKPFDIHFIFAHSMRALDVGMREKPFSSIKTDQLKSLSCTFFPYFFCVKANGMKLLECLHEFLNQSGFAHSWKACNEDILVCQPYPFILF